MNGSPITDRTPLDGLFLNCGWRYRGCKTTPASGWCFAHLIAKGEPLEAAREMRLDRVARGYAIDKRDAGPQPNLH